MRFSRANDRVEPEALAVRPLPEELEGTWFNTNPDTGEIGKIVIAVHEGAVSLEVFAIDAGKLIPWGESVATPYVDRLGSSAVAGFLAEYDLGFVRTRLAANLKLGVLVIQSYNEFHDGSGRPAYFTREFFSQAVAHRTVAPAADSAPGDLRHLIGEWTNTHRGTNGFTQISFEAEGGGCFIRAFGASHPGEWGRAEVIPHAGNAFMARYDRGFAEVTLAANENKGLLIVASYHRFRDGSGRANFYLREFFYRQEVVRR